MWFYRLLMEVGHGLAVEDCEALALRVPNRPLLAICDRSIAPLLRLGLLDAEVEGTEARLRISDIRAATWEQFELRGGRWAKDVV